MTLQEAVTLTLQECGGIATAEEVCRRVNDKGEFKKGDGAPIDPSYLLFGVKNYPDQFEVFLRLRTNR